MFQDQSGEAISEIRLPVNKEREEMKNQWSVAKERSNQVRFESEQVSRGLLRKLELMLFGPLSVGDFSASVQ